MHIQDKFFRC